MIDTKHTPGPWYAAINNKSRNQHGVREIPINKHGIDNIATVYDPENMGFNPDEGNANAALIAAAPDLLEALQLLLNEYNEKDVQMRTPIAYFKAFQKAETAINKATLQPLAS